MKETDLETELKLVLENYFRHVITLDKAILEMHTIIKKANKDKWEEGFLAGSDTAMKTMEAVLGTSSISLTKSKEDEDTHS